MYVKIVYMPFSFVKKCNPPLVVQLLPIFHYSVSIKVLLLFFKIRDVYTKVGTNLCDDLDTYIFFCLVISF